MQAPAHDDAAEASGALAEPRNRAELERRLSDVRDEVSRARELVAAAAGFARQFDVSAAVAWARDAAALLAPLPGRPAADLAAEVEVERARLATREKVWRHEVEARRAAYVAREVSAA